MSGDLGAISRAYDVPAAVGAPVLYLGRSGTITGAEGMYILVQYDDGPDVSLPHHPTWQMEYPAQESK